MTLDREEKIRRLIDSFYEASSTDDSAWGPIYRSICELIGAGPGSINFTDLRNQRFSVVVDTNDPEFLESVNLHYWSLSPFRRQWMALGENETFNRVRDCSDDVFLRSEFYNDLLASRGIYQVVHGCLFSDGTLNGGITFTRPESLGDFGSADYLALEVLLPHVRQALRLRSRFAKLEFEKTLMIETLDRLTQGVLFVDAEMKVIYRNSRAARILESRDGLSQERNGRLAIAAPSEEKRLRNAVRGMLDPLGIRSGATTNSLSVSRPSGGDPFVLTLAPLRSRIAGFSYVGDAVLVLISSLSVELDGVDGYLMEMHGLTPSEARVARKLAEGHSASQIADRLGIKESTVRTHLKRIFAKTSTNRQSELVKMILAVQGRII